MKLRRGKKIMVAPLNWGLGHATRCIPIINALLEAEFELIIASDGEALTLLRKEFPKLCYIELPSYGIRYGNNHQLKWQLFKCMPRILSAVRKEKKQLASLVQNGAVQGVISDNRFGMYHPGIPSVYITHQLTVLSGLTTWLSTYFHHRIIRKFNECWVPDNSQKLFSGALANTSLNVKYLGVVSRLEKKNENISYDYLIVLSGPEPQRSILESQLITEFSNTNYRVKLIRGIFSEEPIKTEVKGVEIINYALKEELERLINASEVVIARSGYSTILDLAKLRKRAFFIPTPGQYEQLYLANHLQNKGIAPYIKQGEFTVKHLAQLANYTGFNTQTVEHLSPTLFELF
ncbi:glycosyltransferase [Flavobacteriaceae bacterium F08102]|nr:glycosyltransferase [Flavobacteriaceae bacterium F08102]